MSGARVKMNSRKATVGFSNKETSITMRNFYYNELWNPPGGQEPEVAEYEQRVTAAGGTLQSGDTALLNAFVTTLKSASIWEKVKDCGFFLGGFDGAFVKLKYLDSFNNCLNTGFLSSHYNELSGLTVNDSTTRKIDTQIIPSDHGLSDTDFSCGIKMIPNNTALNIWMQDDPASGLPNFYMRHDVTVINGSPAESCLNPWTDLNTPRFQFMSLTSSGVVWGTDYQSKYPVPPAKVPPPMNLVNPITVFGGRTNGTSNQSRGTIQFYWIGEYLSWDEIKILEDAVDTFLIAKGRLSNPPVLICFGDSITRGVNASPFTTRYASILAANFGLRLRNMGNHSSKMTGDSVDAWGGYNRRLDLFKFRLSGSKIVIQYGVNDCNTFDTTPTGDPALISTFTSNLVTLCSELIAAGVSPGDIQIGSISIVNTTITPLARQQAWVEGARQAAIAASVKYVDVWQYMTDNGGVATLLSDNAHPNTDGHAAMAFAHTNLADFVS